MRENSEKIYKILIVDDEPSNAESLRELIVNYFPNTVSVDKSASAEDALTKFRNRKYDMAILDVKMPKIDGLSLFKKFKNIRSGFEVIFYTAYPGDFQTAEECRRVGHYIEKANEKDLSELINIIKNKIRGEA